MVWEKMPSASLFFFFRITHTHTSSCSSVAYIVNDKKRGLCFLDLNLQVPRKKDKNNSLHLHASCLNVEYPTEL
jgi:hypothetical protein